MLTPLTKSRSCEVGPIVGVSWWLWLLKLERSSHQRGLYYPTSVQPNWPFTLLFRTTSLALEGVLLAFESKIQARLYSYLVKVAGVYSAFGSVLFLPLVVLTDRWGHEIQILVRPIKSRCQLGRKSIGRLRQIVLFVPYNGTKSWFPLKEKEINICGKTSAFFLLDVLTSFDGI